MATPTSCAYCCILGVAPTSRPVFKSCDVSPAVAAAQQTMLATPSAPSTPALPDIPRMRSTSEENIRAQIVMPETGLFDEPTKPQM